MLTPVFAAEEEGGGSFLVSPDVGLMIWTLLVFVISMYILSKVAFPRIAGGAGQAPAGDRGAIDTAERTRTEADKLLEEYRERLAEARKQADDIVARARKTGENNEAESIAEAKRKREEMMAQTRRDIEQETRRAIQEIRAEVADLTVHGDREGHAQDADRRRPEAARRGGAVRAGLRRAVGRSEPD